MGDGFYIEFAGSYDIPLGNFALSAAVTVGYNGGQYDVPDGFSNITLSAFTDIPIKKVIITPSVNYTFIFEDEINEDSGEFWAGINAGIEF